MHTLPFLVVSCNFTYPRVAGDTTRWVAYDRRLGHAGAYAAALSAVFVAVFSKNAYYGPTALVALLPAFFLVCVLMPMQQRSLSHSLVLCFSLPLLALSPLFLSINPTVLWHTYH